MTQTILSCGRRLTTAAEPVPPTAPAAPAEPAASAAPAEPAAPAAPSLDASQPDSMEQQMEAYDFFDDDITDEELSGVIS